MTFDFDPLVARLKTPAECEAFIENVRKSRPDLVRQAQRRAVELRAQAHGAQTDVEREAIEAVHAAEAAMSHRNGKKTRASRTWQSITKHGILGTVERVVARKQTTDAYSVLVELGMQDKTFEAVVLRHPSAFSEDAINNAKARLDALR